MLATAVATLPSGDGWAYEFKWDGVRALLDVSDAWRAAAQPGRERHHRRLSGARRAGAGHRRRAARRRDRGLRRGPAVLRAAAAADARARQGRPAPGWSQDVPVTYVVFDVLRRYGVDLTARPYRERRATLERFGAEHPDWTISPSFDDGPATAARWRGRTGWRAWSPSGSPRRTGPGSAATTGASCASSVAGEFVVLGWEAAPEHPATLSSLVLGITTEDGLRYAGQGGQRPDRQAGRPVEGDAHRARPAGGAGHPARTAGPAGALGRAGGGGRRRVLDGHLRRCASPAGVPGYPYRQGGGRGSGDG